MSGTKGLRFQPASVNQLDGFKVELGYRDSRVELDFGPVCRIDRAIFMRLKEDLRSILSHQ